MIQRVYITINNSMRVRSFITACKNFITSAKVFLFCGLGILLNIFSFIRYVLVLTNNYGWLTDIITTICNIILCAICLVSIWIILELVAFIIEMKYPISAAEIEAKCIDADSRCFPRNQTLEINPPNTSESNFKRNVFKEDLQGLQTSMSTQHELSIDLNRKECFKPAYTRSYLPSSKHNQKLGNQLQTDINRPSTSVQRSKSLSSEVEKSTWNMTDYAEQRTYSQAFLAQRVMNQQNPPNVSPSCEFVEKSTSTFWDRTNDKEKLVEHSKHANPELQSHPYKTSLYPSFERKSDVQHSTSATNFEHRCFEHKNERKVAGKRIELRCGDSPSDTKLSSVSSLEVDVSFDDSSSEVTATASEGDSSWTEDSPTKTVQESFHGNSKSTFSNNLCRPREENFGTTHKTLESKFENSNTSEITRESEVRKSTCAQKNSELVINDAWLNTKKSNSILSKTSTQKEHFKTCKEVETAGSSDEDTEASCSCQEITSSEATTDDESSKYGDLIEETSRSKEWQNALVGKDSDSATNAACLKVKVAGSNENARPANLSKNIKTETSFGVTTSVTDKETKASFSYDKAARPARNIAEKSLLSTSTTDSLRVSTESISFSVAESSVAAQTSLMSHITELGTLTFSLTTKEGTKTDSKTQVMSAKFKRSITADVKPVTEAQNVPKLKRKYESSNSDSGSENSSNATSHKRRAKRRTKSCSTDDKLISFKNTKESGKEGKF